MSARALSKLVMADPDVATVYYWVGANPTVNTGRMMIDLKPMSERTASATEVLNRLRKASLQVPGIALFGQARQDVQIGTRVSKTQYQYTLQAPNVGELFQWAPVVLEKLSALPQLQDVTGDLQAAAPRASGRPDLTGVWRFNADPYTNNVTVDLKPDEIDPSVVALYKQRQEDLGKDDGPVEAGRG